MPVGGVYGAMACYGGSKMQMYLPVSVWHHKSCMYLCNWLYFLLIFKLTQYWKYISVSTF